MKLKEEARAHDGCRASEKRNQSLSCSPPDFTKHILDHCHLMQSNSVAKREGVGTHVSEVKVSSNTSLLGKKKEVT
jgi:hypothetical protein